MNKEEELKTRRVQLLIKPSTYDEIKRRADKIGKSVNDYIHKLLECDIERNANKPNELQRDDQYYYITGDGEIMIDSSEWFDELCVRLDIGNYFKTREEAEFQLERLKVLAELREYEVPCKIFETYHIYAVPSEDRIAISVWNTPEINYREIHFESREKAKEAINKIGLERLLKYYFKVPTKVYRVPIYDLTTTDGFQQYLTQKGEHMFACRYNPKLKQTFTLNELNSIHDIYSEMAEEVDE